MPDGHCWEIKGGMDFQTALASMYYDGQRSLLAADQRWRDDHNAKSEPTAPLLAQVGSTDGLDAGD